MNELLISVGITLLFQTRPVVPWLWIFLGGVYFPSLRTDISMDRPPAHQDQGPVQLPSIRQLLLDIPLDSTTLSLNSQPDSLFTPGFALPSQYPEYSPLHASPNLYSPNTTNPAEFEVPTHLNHTYIPYHPPQRDPNHIGIRPTPQQPRRKSKRVKFL
jgi:hypothetical protein